MPRSLFVLSILIVVAGCRFDDPGQPAETPPDWLRSTYPDDGATGLADDEGIDLVARFRQPITAERLTTTRIIPTPVSVGGESFEVENEYVVEDVVLDPAVATYYWLIHGSDFVEPVVVRLHPVGQNRLSGYVSARITMNQPGQDVEGTILFVLAYDVPPELLPPTEETLFGLPIFAIHHIDPASAGASGSFVSNLYPYRNYILVAVKDTDGDGRFNPGLDAFGYPHDSSRPNVPDPWWAASSGDFDGYNPGTAPIVVYPPGRLNPPIYPGSIAATRPTKGRDRVVSGASADETAPSSSSCPSHGPEMP